MPHKSINLFKEIKNPDPVIFILLFNACAQLGTVEELNLIKKVSSTIPESFYSKSFVSSSLLDAFIKCGDISSAETLFAKMEKNVINYGNLMNAFNKEDQPEKTLNLFNQMKTSGIEASNVIYLCVIKALSKFGDYDTSQSVIEQIPNSFLCNDQIQTTLIHMWVRSNRIYLEKIFSLKISFQGKCGSINEAKEIFEKKSQLDQFAYAAMGLF
jgi:pentatricopeptide repeat protein